MYKSIVLVSTLWIVVLSGGISGAEEVPSWYDGFYVGAQIGYIHGDADHDYSNGAPSGNSSPDGFSGGGFVGYQKHIDKFTVGIEFDYNKPSADGSFIDTSGSTSGGSSEIKSIYSIKVKIGRLIDSLKISPYLTGGLSYCDVDLQGGPFNAPQAGNYSAKYSGWVAGVGVERSITESFTARLEYLYADYGSKDGNLAPGYPGVQMPVELVTNSILLGIYYNF